MHKDDDDDNKHLPGVVFNPMRSVTYRPIAAKQVAVVEITNNETQPVMFKWKSTRPGYYKMRPIYGVIECGAKASVNLYFAGVKKDVGIPPADRFTCVLAASPSANVNAENVFKNKKYQQKLAQSGTMRKKKIMVVFEGINDKEPIKDEGTEDNDESNEKDRVGNMRKKQKSESATTKSTDSKPKKKMPTVVMFMRKEGESESGEEEEEEGALKTVRVAENVQKQVVPNASAEPPKGTPTKNNNNDDMKTVAPAGAFANKAVPNAKK